MPQGSQSRHWGVFGLNPVPLQRVVSSMYCPGPQVLQGRHAESSSVDVPLQGTIKWSVGHVVAQSTQVRPPSPDAVHWSIRWPAGHASHGTQVRQSGSDGSASGRGPVE